MRASDRDAAADLVNVGGGRPIAHVARAAERLVRERFGDQPVGADPRPRRSTPWLVLDASPCARQFGSGHRRCRRREILEEIAAHADGIPTGSTSRATAETHDDCHATDRRRPLTMLSRRHPGARRGRLHRAPPSSICTSSCGCTTSPTKSSSSTTAARDATWEILQRPAAAGSRSCAVQQRRAARLRPRGRLRPRRSDRATPSSS